MFENTTHVEDIASFVRIMLGEVRVSADEAKSAKASRDASAHVSYPYSLDAGVVAGPIPKGKGI
eukprot:5058822-Prorocentrum_lima.AAC.1